MAKKILFTGLDKATFKMGDKMLKVVREAVKKHGKENVTLVHGGRPNKSIIDKNIIRLAEGTGVKVQSDPLDYSIPKNAAGARTQKRIDDPNLEWHSFDSSGKLSLKDKYQSYWKNKYGEIGKETSGGKLKFPRSKVKDNKVIGKSTKETSKFKSLLDEIEDDTNPERQASGVRYAKNLDKWTKENFNINMITEKNRSRIDFLEGGVSTKMDEYVSIGGKPTIKRGTPTIIRQQPSFKREYKSIDDFEQKTFVEDTSDLGREGQSEYGGSGSLPTGFKGKNKGTLLTEPTVVSVKRTGDMTDRQIRSKNPYPQSSMSQIAGSTEYEDFKGQKQEGGRKIEIKNSLKQLTDQTDITETGYGEDKTKSGKGVERHTTSHLIKEQPIKDRVEIKRTLKKFASVFKRLSEAEKKVKTGTNKPKILQNLKRLDNVAKNLAKQIPDRLAFDAAQPTDSTTPARSSTVQSSGLKNVPVPKATKVVKDKALRAKIAKGPYGGVEKQGTEQHYKGWSDRTKKIRQGIRQGLPKGLGAFSLFSTILAPIKARKEAKKFTGKKDPSFMDSMKMIYPFLGKPRKKHGLNYGDL